MPTMMDRDSVNALLQSANNRNGTAKSHRFLPPSHQQRRLQQLEPFPGVHIGHISVYHDGHMIVLSGYGGYKENLSTNYRPNNEIWVYDQEVEKWMRKTCTSETASDMPCERSGASGTVIDNDLYMFGGYAEEGNLNTLHRLDLTTLQWRQLSPSGNPPLPSDKKVCWSHDGKFYLFAGYGCGPNPAHWRADIGYQFILDTSSHWHYLRGWSNQFVCYDPKTNAWEWPQCTGDIPVPRAAHAAAKIGRHVYLFGGRNGKNRMNDMYALDMDTLVWTQIMSNDESSPIAGRSWHSLTRVSDDSLILYGGFSSHNKPLNDCWIFNTVTHAWKRIELPYDKPRLWHTAVLSSDGEVLVFGGAIGNIMAGICRNHSKQNVFAHEMFTIQFQPKSLFRFCLDAASHHEEMLQSNWNELPLQLQSILYDRCLMSPALSVQNSTSNSIGGGGGGGDPSAV